MEAPTDLSQALRQDWEIELDDGWQHFTQDVYEARGSSMQFTKGKFQYKVEFTSSNEGIQENLSTGKKRRLRRRIAKVTASRAAPRTTDSHWSDNLAMVRKELLQTYPQVADEAHPVHTILVRAQKAEDDGKWEIAFNELFEAGDALKRIGADCITNRTTEASTSSSSRETLKRARSVALSEMLGEPRRVVRRFLEEANGDEQEAIERAFMIRDLEQGYNCQLELNSKSEECSLCLERCDIREVMRLWPCKHGWYCVTCMRRAADAKMADGVLLGGIGCPECRRGLSEALLRAILTKEQMDRLHRLSLESAVAASDRIRPCPTPDCPNRVVLEDGITPRLKCEFCRKEHCLLCSASPYHDGKTCEEHLAEVRDNGEEQLLRKWMSQVGAKQCPKCRSVVTKHNLKNQSTQASECHKMICRTCRTKFCFSCLAILTESFSCGCTPDNHGFLDPDTGAFVQHLVPAQRRRRR